MNPLFFLIALLIPVWFDGVPTSCLVDTGATATLLSQWAAGRIGTLGPAIGQDQLRTASGTALPVQWHAVRNVGTQHFGWSEGVIAVAPKLAQDVGVECVLGTDFLARQPIRISWIDQQLLPG